MKQLQLLMLGVLFSPILMAQKEATLLYHWHDASIVPTSWLNSRYNEVWGFAIDGREYGVIGTTDGMRIFDVTDPANVPAPIKVAAPATGPGIIHRDMKDWRGFLYAVCDEGASTLQVVDLRKLPTEAPVVYNSNEFVVTAHNLFIDTSQNRLYLLGAGNTIKILDISNPAKPALLASHPGAGYYLPYVHDAYIHNHIGVMNCGNSGLWVVDFSNPTAPVTLGTMTNYPGNGYNHSGWMSDDGQHYYLCDETHGSPVKSIDFSKFEDMKVVGTMRPNSFANEIPHNAITKGNLLFVSYYYDGLQVFDISDPENPKKVLYYDTFDGPNGNSFQGSWGVYPDLPSGNILLSDMNTGFWVFAPAEEPSDYLVRTNHPFLVACEGGSVRFNITLGKNLNQQPLQPVIVAPSGAQVQMPTGTFQPGDEIPIEVHDLPVGNTTITCTVNDGIRTRKSVMHLIVKKELNAPLPQLPAQGAVNQSLTPLLRWEAVVGVSQYLVEISTAGGSEFDANIIYSTTRTTNNFVLNAANLQPLTHYFWRVSVVGLCGRSYSEIFDFTTRSTVGTLELPDHRAEIFPNPASETLFVQLEAAAQTELQLEIWNTNGQAISRYILPVGGQQQALPVAHLPAGHYFLVMKNEAGLARLPFQKN